MFLEACIIGILSGIFYYFYYKNVWKKAKPVEQMGGYLSRRGQKTEDTSEKKNPSKSKLQKQRQRLVSERLHLYDEEGSSCNLDEVDSAATVKNPKFKKIQKMPSILNDIEVKVMKINPADYEYPFENLCFEGGGNKGLAYCGALRVLEEINVFPQIKRLAGASAGAMTAALVAVGYNSYEIEEFLSQDLSHMFLDASFGYLSLLPNLVMGYGWNPGNRIYEWFGRALARKTNDPDISFLELYRKTGKELCVVVTNLNHMAEEYCHPKTTPDMPVRLAVRMSMSIPGLFQATTYTAKWGETNTYVDGGVLCNYPIHCFDGWWLSMKPGDSFLQRLQPLEKLPKLLAKSERFGTCNQKTLGFLLYADSEHEVFRFDLEQRIGTQLPDLPDTELARKKKKEIKVREKVHSEHRRITNAVNELLRVLQKHDIDGGGTINKTELANAFADDEFSEMSSKLLFGNQNLQECFDTLDIDKDGEIEYNELIDFVESQGVFLTQRYLGYQRKNINGLFSFFDTLQSALLTNVKRLYVDDKDLNRTVGINTGHVGTSDFKLEDGDRRFVVEQGRRAVTSFLKYYVAHNKPAKRSPSESATEQISIEIAENIEDDAIAPAEEETPILENAGH